MGVTTGRRSCVATQNRFPNKAKPTWNSSKRSAAIFNVVYLRDSHQRWIRHSGIYTQQHTTLSTVLTRGLFFNVALCWMPAQNRQDLNVTQTQAFSSTNASRASRQAFQRYPLLESRSLNHREKSLGLTWMNLEKNKCLWRCKMQICDTETKEVVTANTQSTKKKPQRRL